MTQLKKSILSYLEKAEEPKSTTDIQSFNEEQTTYNKAKETLFELKEENKVELIEDEKDTKVYRYWTLKDN